MSYIYSWLLCMGITTIVYSQKPPNKLVEERLAVAFFLDSLYPNRAIIKDKVLYTDGKVFPGRYSIFVFEIPNYREIIKKYNREYELGIYRVPPKLNDPIHKLRGRFSPRKWGLKRMNENCYGTPMQDPRKMRKPRYPPSGFVRVYSMYYDSTQTEKLVAIKILINGFLMTYQWVTYAFVFRDQKIVYWREREDWDPQGRIQRLREEQEQEK